MLVIFGSNGDLAKRKLLPAIFQLYLDNLLPEKFVVIGAGSQEKAEQTNRADVHNSHLKFSPKGAAANPEKLDAFLNHIYYQKVHNQTEEDFGLLETMSKNYRLNLKFRKHNLLFFHTSIFIRSSCSAFGKIRIKYGRRWLETDNCGKTFWIQLRYSHRFGQKTSQRFQRDQIYRIDHI
jgi:glucose-6-phosphate 1-dehydrogenase